jgi:hypothetical protein
MHVCRTNIHPSVFFSKTFLSIGALLLVCLFVCFVCLCSMIDAIRVNAIREVLKSLKLKILSNYPLVKGKCVLVLLSQ